MQPTLKSIYKHFIIGLLFISSAFQFQSFAQTTAIPDSNFESVLVNLNIDTNGINGNILNSDAEYIQNLYISDNFIQSLVGIEAFINLKNLDCSMNNLNALDVSQNTQLESLIANDNQIGSINVLTNNKLEYINLSSNQLYTLDVSNNPYLESLSIDLNNLNALNVSNNLQLEYLGCYSNNLATIDLSNNTFLKHVFLSFNNLSELDLTQNTIIRTLSCSSNNILELDLLLNPDLSYFDCRDNDISTLDLSNNIDLKRLFVSNNYLTELDITNNSNLLLLYARYNNISALDISNNLDLRWIKCEGNNLSSVDFRNGNNNNISEFIMTGNSNLSCIYVDNANASYLDNWVIDDSSTFVEDETDCEALSTESNFFLTSFSLYPNPATENVSITINVESAKLELYNIKGQLMLSQIINYGKNSVSLDAFSSGMYLVRISSNNFTETKKLVLN